MIHKKLLSLLVLLMTVASGAWAAVYNSGEVYTTDLKVGDVIIYGASIHNKFKLAANRYKLNGSVQTGNSYEFQNMGLGTNGSLSGGYAPVTADGQDGNAWVVLSLKAENSDYVMLGGINYTPEGIYPATDAQKEGDPFTEATFAMPAFDATANYDIVRDMSVQMTAQVGDGTQEQPRYRVKKDGNNKFIPADMEMAAVPALFTVNDAIEQKALTQTQDYIVQIYAIDAEGQPTGDPMTFATFTFEPGIYAVKAVAADGSDYDGETALSNTFKLFQGYEVKLGPGEFATFYKDEKLKLDPETSNDAKIYTIASVSDDQAVLSSPITVVPEETPILVHNPTTASTTFLLLPTTTDQADAIMTVYGGFKGTLTAATIAASTSTKNNYALNGKQFVWVKNAIDVAANKCWLEVSTSNARALNIVFADGEATGLSEKGIVNSDKSATATWYDLNGRKLNAAPNRKGIYIQNGKKVVVK